MTEDGHAGHDPEDCEPSDCDGCGKTVPRCQMPKPPYCAECRGWEDYVDEFGYG